MCVAWRSPTPRGCALSAHHPPQSLSFKGTPVRAETPFSTNTLPVAARAFEGVCSCDGGYEFVGKFARWLLLPRNGCLIVL